MVATLKPLKRVEHAVRAIAAVSSAGQSVTLDIYGRDAGSRADIERTIAGTGTASLVTLHGYSANAAQHFAHASFSLMTSLTEGQSLVLLESMAAGCVPISYDIRYGPAEVIVDGETGFLVPAGDLDALIETIRRYLTLPSRKLRRLRRQCQERLAAFSDAEVFARWTEVQRAALRQSRRRIQLTDLTVGAFEIGSAGEYLAVSALVTADWDASRWTAADVPLPTASLLVAGRRRGAPQRLLMDLEALDRSAPPSRFRATILLDPRQVDIGEPVGDVYLELGCEATARQVRLRGGVEATVPGAEVFATSFGNVSVRKLSRAKR